MENYDMFSKKLLGLKSTLPALIVADHFNQQPDMARSYSEYQKENFLSDIGWIISFLAESVWAREPLLFEEFISWLKTFLISVGVPAKDLEESLRLLKARINEACSADENSVVNAFLGKAISQVMTDDLKTSLAAMDNTLIPLAQDYLDWMLKGERNMALSMVLDKVEAGFPMKDLYLKVFQPVQYELGRLWQTNRISVAQEHYCTAATQLVMSQLYPYLFTGQRHGRKMVVACAPGELHELGARMVSDFFEMEGWDTYYLGANMPVKGIINFLGIIKPALLAISVTLMVNLRTVAEMISKIRATPEIPAGMKILAGGYPFRVANDLWQRIGADGWAVNAQEAVDLAGRLISST